MEKFNLKERRLALGLTLEDVGKFVGVGKSTVKKWETGFIENMKRDKIALLAEKLKVSPLEIVGINSIDTFGVNQQVLTTEQQALVDTYDQLNQTGKQKLTDYANDLVSSGRYSSDDDIRTFKVAARNGKDTIELTKEQREELIKISKEPFDIPKGTF